MLKAVYESLLNAEFSTDDEVTAGLVAMLDTASAGEFKISDGTAAFGLISETNKTYATGYGDYRSAVNPIPAVGDKIGLYHDGGIFVTDQFVAGTYAPGDLLYVTTEGKLVNVLNEDTPAAPTDADGTLAVGVVISASATELKFQLTI